jgi:hypothetical protein
MQQRAGSEGWSVARSIRHHVAGSPRIPLSAIPMPATARTNGPYFDSNTAGNVAQVVRVEKPTLEPVLDELALRVTQHPFRPWVRARIRSGSNSYSSSAGAAGSGALDSSRASPRSFALRRRKNSRRPSGSRQIRGPSD